MDLHPSEGELSTPDVKPKYIDSGWNNIEATYVLRDGREWDRFMRFMDRYAEANDLGSAEGRSIG